MTFSLSSLLTCGNRPWRFLSAGLCLATAASTTASAMSVHARARGAPPEHYCSRETLGSAPGYLIASGPVGFRFAPPPPVATERPVVAPVAVVAPPKENEPVANAPVAPTAATTTEKSVKPTNAAPKPAPVIPDDTPSDVHPEDILPYFKLPHGGSTSSVDVPFKPASPNSMPKSSASYDLQ